MKKSMIVSAILAGSLMVASMHAIDLGKMISTAESIGGKGIMLYAGIRNIENNIKEAQEKAKQSILANPDCAPAMKEVVAELGKGLNQAFAPIVSFFDIMKLLNNEMVARLSLEKSKKMDEGIQKSLSLIAIGKDFISDINTELTVVAAPEQAATAIAANEKLKEKEHTKIEATKKAEDTAKEKAAAKILSTSDKLALVANVIAKLVTKSISMVNQAKNAESNVRVAKANTKALIVANEECAAAMKEVVESLGEGVAAIFAPLESFFLLIKSFNADIVAQISKDAGDKFNGSIQKALDSATEAKNFISDINAEILKAETEAAEAAAQKAEQEAAARAQAAADAAAARAAARKPVATVKPAAPVKPAPLSK